MCYVIQGSAPNWHHSLRDLEGELRPVKECPGECLNRLRERKKRGRILWAFNNPNDYSKLDEALKNREKILIVGVSTKGRGGQSERNIVVVGEVGRDDLVGECKCNYWPEGEKWHYKFFINIRLWLDRNKSDIGIKFPVFQGSLSEIDCRLVEKIIELASSVGYNRWYEYRPIECPLKISNEIFKRVKGDIIVDTIDVDFLVKSVSLGNVLLAGPPGVGKTKAAISVANAYNGDRIIAVAHALWFRRDVIGGESLGPDGLYWKSGLLIKAYNKAAEAILSGTPKPVFLIIDEVNRADVDKAFAEFFAIFTTPFCKDWSLPQNLVNEVKSYHRTDEDAKRFVEYYNKLQDEPLRLIRVIATMNVKDWRNLFLTGEAFLRRFIVIKADCKKDYSYVEKIDVRDDVKKALLDHLKNKNECIPPAAVIGALRLLNLGGEKPSDSDIEKAINAVLGSRKYILGRGR